MSRFISVHMWLQDEFHENGDFREVMVNSNSIDSIEPIIHSDISQSDLNTKIKIGLYEYHVRETFSELRKHLLGGE